MDGHLKIPQTLSRGQREKAEALFKQAQELQQTYWNKLKELSIVTGVTFDDDGQNLSTYTLDDFI